MLKEDEIMRRKLLFVSAAIVVIVAGAMGATYFLITPRTSTSTSTATSTLPTVSPYIAEFREKPELFAFHTKVLYIIFEDESGDRLGNLTGVLEVTRDGYTVNLVIRYSLDCDPSIEKLTFESGVVWIITEGPEPVPIPTPMPQNITLRNGESAIFYSGSDEFGENWEYALITILSDISRFQIQFLEGRQWESEEKYYFYSAGEDLFAFLHLNKVETEIVQIKMSTP